MSALPVPSRSGIRQQAASGLLATIDERLRLNRRGRRVLRVLTALAVLGAMVLIALAIALLPGFAGGPAFASTSAPSVSEEIEYVTVGAGDSLWEIAARVSEGSDPRDTMVVIAELNALESSELVPGQQLAVPVAD